MDNILCFGITSLVAFGERALGTCGRLFVYLHICFSLYLVYLFSLFTTLVSIRRDYNPNDRINAKAQLDPQTGKSFQYLEALGTKSD